MTDFHRFDVSAVSPVPVSGGVAGPLLEVQNLSVGFGRRGRYLPAVRDISFTVAPGECVGIVGESGSGKTLTGLALMGLVPTHSARVTGRVLLSGQDLLTCSRRALRRIRGRSIAMIFQEPMSALDPVFSVGEQIVETLLAHTPMSRRDARERAIELLALVGIPAPQLRIDDYPHLLSGGMRQRVMIAMALACEPRLLIADEPTTALDVTVQAQIIDLLLDCSQRLGTALLFITHDFGVVAESCTRVLTMYAGEIVEDAPVDDILLQPKHPYTSGLIRSIPRLSPPKTRLPAIPGRVPGLADVVQGCRFGARCGMRQPDCSLPQTLVEIGTGRVRCCRQSEFSLPGAIQ